MVSSKRPVNKAEGSFWDYARSKGWEVSKRGWPDFFCWKDGKIALVEVKGSRGRRLKGHQRFIMEQLAQFGIGCYRWDDQDRTFRKIGTELYHDISE